MIVRTYKAAATTLSRTQGLQALVRQPKFYEHIIRDGEDLDRIREYILENPMNWEVDKDHAKNIRMDPMHRGKSDWSALD